MSNIKASPSTIRYAQEFKYWKETATAFFAIAEKQIETALESQLDDTTMNADIADAWHKCITAQWTLLKSGKQTANRMGLTRGIDNRQFHPAQLRKKGKSEMSEKVDRALDRDETGDGKN